MVLMTLPTCCTHGYYEIAPPYIIAEKENDYYKINKIAFYSAIAAAVVGGFIIGRYINNGGKRRFVATSTDDDSDNSESSKSVIPPCKSRQLSSSSPEQKNDISSEQISFYFFNDSENSNACMSATVITPSGEQFHTNAIFAQNGAVTPSDLILKAENGTYQLSIINMSIDCELSAEVAVLKNGLTDSVIKFPAGNGNTQEEMTVTHTHR